MIGKLVLLSLLALAHGKPYKPSPGGPSAPERCLKGQRHYLLPHEYDCTKFYYCEYGVRRDEPTSCAPGTEFSARFQVCVFPAQANCRLPGVPPTEEVDNLPESVEQIPDVEEQKPVKPRPESDKPKPEKPQPGNGKPKPKVAEQEPEMELNFQIELEERKPAKPQPESERPKPVKPQPESDKPKPVKPQPESDKPKPVKPQPESDKPKPVKPQPESDKPKPPPKWLPNGCPANIHVSWLLPHESQCDKFYYCNFGEKVLTACVPGTYFNSKIQACDWPENVNCPNTDSGSEDNSQ